MRMFKNLKENEYNEMEMEDIKKDFLIDLNGIFRGEKI